MLENYINLLRSEVKIIFSKDSTGHDIGHLARTMNNALFLQKYEGGDKLVIGVSAFLHDIHRVVQNEQNKYCSPKESLPIIKELLEKIKIPVDKTKKVLHAIEYHEEYNWNNPDNQTNDIETLILQDADNLDAIGAIGVARTFQYSGAYGLPMYDESVPIDKNNPWNESKGHDASNIHHFYNKLFRLCESMNTPTAFALAQQKKEFMENFVETFMEEWHGTYNIIKKKGK